MNVKNDNINIGDCAPLTALETDENQDNNDSSLVDDENAFGDIDKEDESPEDTTIQPSSNETAEQTGEEGKRIRHSTAARKRYKYLIALGMSKEAACEGSLRPVEQMMLERIQKVLAVEDRTRSGGIKICIVSQDFPLELFSSDQVKIIEEAIMAKVMEVKQDNPIKPKFNSCVHRPGWLTIFCLDEATAKWLINLALTLQPWEGALLKGLRQNEMLYPEYYVAFFPDSMDCPTEKILKFLEIQNRALSIPSWNIIKRVVLEPLIELTFSIDRKYTNELEKVGYKVNYKFGVVKLWHQTDRRAAENHVKQRHPWREAANSEQVASNSEQVASNSKQVASNSEQVASNSEQVDPEKPTRKRKGYFKRRREQLKALKQSQPDKKFKSSPRQRYRTFF